MAASAGVAGRLAPTGVADEFNCGAVVTGFLVEQGVCVCPARRLRLVPCAAARGGDGGRR